MSNSLTTRGEATIGAHHLGGVKTVMMVARDEESREVFTVPLRLLDQKSDSWIFEVGNETWQDLVELALGRVCLVAQVDERFVTIDAQIQSFQDDQRLVVIPETQTFWDVPSGRVFRVASGIRRPSVQLDLPASPDVLLGE